MICGMKWENIFRPKVGGLLSFDRYYFILIVLHKICVCKISIQVIPTAWESPSDNQLG